MIILGCCLSQRKPKSPSRSTSVPTWASVRGGLELTLTGREREQWCCCWMAATSQSTVMVQLAAWAWCILRNTTPRILTPLRGVPLDREGHLRDRCQQAHLQATELGQVQGAPRHLVEEMKLLMQGLQGGCPTVIEVLLSV